MYERFTDRGRKVLQLANQEAQRFNHDCIGTEHIVLGLIKEGSGIAASALKNLGVDLRAVRLEVEGTLGAGPAAVTVGKLPLTPRAMKALQYSVEESRQLNHDYVGTEHLLLGVLRERQGAGFQILVKLGLTAEQVRREIMRLLSLTQLKLSSSAETDSALQASPPDMSRVSLLEHFGRDLTKLAAEGVLDPVVGRDRELEQLVGTVCRDSMNHALLVGDEGVGKTALVEGLARRIASGSVPESLRYGRVVSVDAATLAPREGFRWLLAERVQRIIGEASKEHRFCFLFENMDVLMADDGTRGIIVSMTSPEAGAKLRFIGTTTPQAATSLGSDSSVCAGFSMVTLEPLTPERTLAVLQTLRGRAEAMYRILIADEALEAAVELGRQQAGAIRLPGAAIQLLESACLLVRPQGEQLYWRVADVDAKIERLIEEKEAAVAEQDFEKAARLRDQAETLKIERERPQKESLKQQREARCVVDRAAVMAAAGR